MEAGNKTCQILFQQLSWDWFEKVNEQTNNIKCPEWIWWIWLVERLTVLQWAVHVIRRRILIGWGWALIGPLRLSGSVIKININIYQWWRIKHDIIYTVMMMKRWIILSSAHLAQHGSVNEKATVFKKCNHVVTLSLMVHRFVIVI